MPRKNQKYKKRKRGYRRRLCAPKKGCPRYKGSITTTSEQNTQFHETSETSCQAAVEIGFLGFDVPPLSRQIEAITVLSLFDGIGTGLVALTELGIPVKHYFSSEINEKAISVLKYNHYDRVTVLGCINTLTEATLLSLGTVHLVLGGSPCSDLSLVNPNRRGLHGEGSSGQLFFEFVRVKDFLATLAANHGTKFFWLFENTTAMERCTLQEMSRALGVDPAVRCSSEFVPMARRRYFWGNIPQLHDQTPDKDTHYPDLQDFLMPYRIAAVPCLPTLTSTRHSQRSGKEKILPVSENGASTALLVTEEEALFGLPSHYTDTGISLTDRRRLLGKAWCVPVLKDILKKLIPHFSSTS